MSLSPNALSRHRRRRRRRHYPKPDQIVLPPPPTDEEKYCYVDRQLPYLATIVALGFVAATVSQVWFEITSGWWGFAIFTFASTMSFGLALPLSFVGRGFDLDAHSAQVASWQPTRYPNVDIFLPICNEPLSVLRNTWSGVAQLVRAYLGEIDVVVLDDGQDPAPGRLAEQFGFRHLARPHRGFYKKSGNLRVGFANTSGEFIVVLDADFVPRPDSLRATSLHG